MENYEYRKIKKCYPEPSRNVNTYKKNSFSTQRNKNMWAVGCLQIFTYYLKLWKLKDVCNIS